MTVEFPAEIRGAIEKRIEGCGVPQAQLKQLVRDLSDRYKNESGAGKNLIKSELDAAVYAAVRMPATFGAVSSALRYAFELYETDISSLLDVGAGSGAATWAAFSLLDLEKVTCIEREGIMQKLGEALMRQTGTELENAGWIKADLLSLRELEKADLVIASYVINELAECDRQEAINKLWDAAGKMLVIVEPGTPAGFRVVKQARQQLLAVGAHIAAPCPHEKDCRIDESDWCHFTCRVQRSKLHKLLKDGDAPYEDEKFTYMAFVREPVKHSEARILRHPQISKAQVEIAVCTEAENTKLTLRKKDGAVYKQASKARCGDALELSAANE